MNPTIQLVYVIGEVLISVIVLAGAYALLFLSEDQGVKVAASGMASAVLVFWFQRRAGESGQNAVTTLANGKIDSLSQRMGAIEAQLANVNGQLSTRGTANVPVTVSAVAA